MVRKSGAAGGPRRRFVYINSEIENARAASTPARIGEPMDLQSARTHVRLRTQAGGLGRYEPGLWPESILFV